jgi:sulfur carrier protein ThiS
VGGRVRVSVDLCAVLRERGRERPGVIELAEGATLAEAISDLGLSDAPSAIVCVNGKPVPEDAPLAEGDSLYVFLPVSGG